MSDFIFVTGKLGQGKTLASISKIKEYLLQGRRVATNVDLNLLPMLGKFNRSASVIRIPDKPTVADLELIGYAYDQSKGYNENLTGLLVLDECGTWFNARNWQDKSRAGLNNWMIHARKLGWDVHLIVQDISIVDSQARDSLAAGIAYCKRLDKLRIPGGGILKMFTGWEPRLPRLHVARVMDEDKLMLDRWVYRGDELFGCYDTRQHFRSDYPHSTHSILPPWHTHGRYIKPAKDVRMRLTKIYLKKYSRPVLLSLGFFIGSLASLAVAYKAPLTPTAPSVQAQPQTAPNSPPKSFSDTWAGWSYDGSYSINTTYVYFLINPDGIRIPTTDSIFEGMTLSEPSACALKLQKGSDYIYLKCKHEAPASKPQQPAKDAESVVSSLF